MATLSSISQTLRKQLQALKLTQETVRQDTGITRRTLTNVLSGKQDYKLTTLLAIADRLGLDVVLLPKEAARGINLTPTTTPTPPKVTSTVQATLERLRAKTEQLK
ncbi:helix-turn-helix transcriptional regulator [Advenella sp. WQ 585]|uniref:Helix-turn-helix transcriptional regulator n=1 Tax=Advenella mandrilli TaxID=2800330 RepID=A0ABS1ECW9_9BURK|nr:helix-turn-helix transcriptional regulator [Advenella mandrilli]MBK1781787.1 helix-turn-helix transcriptional regulator [Advenella mandrilli]